MAGESRKNAVLDLISQGEYDYQWTRQTGQSYVAGTPAYCNLVSNAGTKDLVINWVRAQYAVSSASTAPCMATIVIWKLLNGESPPAAVDTAWIEKTRESGRLFCLKQYVMRKLTNGPQVLMKDEFFNVKLKVGEILGWAVVNRSASIADGIFECLVEKRVLEVGV